MMSVKEREKPNLSWHIHEAVKIARQLGYSKDAIDRIRHADSEHQVDRIMAGERRRLAGYGK